MPSDYHIERAKSGRASCKKCKEVIKKDELRIGISSMKNDITMTAWQHPKCFSIPRTIKLDAASFVDEHLVDQTADSILDDPDKKQEIIDQIASKAQKEVKEENPASKKIESYKKMLASLPEESDEEGETRPAKKAKKGSSSEELELAAKALRVYQKMKNAELQDILRWNLGYGMSGTKDILLLRCIDGHANGRLARCPTCFKGHLQLTEKDAGETITCGGYFDEDMGVRVACTFITKNASAPRLQPWYTEQPTEEEVEKMKETTEEHVGKASGGGTSDGAPTELIDRANELEWPDTTTMAGKKEAANLMVELCTSGGVVVDLPQDEKKAKMSVGKIIVGNPGASSATEILELIVKEFGIASKKLALAEQQKQAISVSCACPANAGVMQAFLELADLYFKEGNSNAAGSYKRAATAIMGIPFEITEDNAKGLAKPKTKVANIGKSSADKMYEFVTTGTIEKLEEKRNLAA